MKLLTSPKKTISSRHISVAAEAMAAAQFALNGFDVLEQAGRARFFYDLGVAKSGGMLKVSVHGSLDGFWDLVDSYLDRKMNRRVTRADYHRAIGLWLKHHSFLTCCLVQFESEDLGGMPRIYLASAAEIAAKLHELADKLGDTALYEQFEVTNGFDGTHVTETLPASWRFSATRIKELLESPSEETTLRYRFSSAATCAECAEAKPAACVKCLPMMN